MDIASYVRTVVNGTLKLGPGEGCKEARTRITIIIIPSLDFDLFQGRTFMNSEWRLPHRTRLIPEYVLASFYHKRII